MVKTGVASVITRVMDRDFGLKFLQWKHRDFLMMTSIGHQKFTGMTVLPVMLRQAGISLDSTCFNDSRNLWLWYDFVYQLAFLQNQHHMSYSPLPT